MYWPKSHSRGWERRVDTVSQDTPRDRSVWAHRCTFVHPTNTAGTMLGATTFRNYMDTDLPLVKIPLQALV